MFHPAGGAVFTLQDHFGAVMTIPQNTLQIWPGYSGSHAVDVAILPQHNMVITILKFILSFDFYVIESLNTA